MFSLLYYLSSTDYQISGLTATISTDFCCPSNKMKTQITNNRLSISQYISIIYDAFEY